VMSGSGDGSFQASSPVVVEEDLLEKVYQPVVDRRRQVEFSQLGQQRGVSDGVERLGKVQ